MAQSPAGKPRKTPKPAASPKKAAGSSASKAPPAPSKKPAPPPLPAQKKRAAPAKPAAKAPSPALADTTPKGKAADWERIELDYRAGIKTVRQIATENGITHGLIGKRVRNEGWERDLKAKIQAKAEALVSKAAVSTEVSSERRAAEKSVIDANAQAIVTVRLAHRQDIARARTLTNALLLELEQSTDPLNRELLAGLPRLVLEADASAPKLAAIFDAIMSLPERSKTMKTLVEGMQKLIDMERTAFGLEDKDQPGTTPGTAGYVPPAVQVMFVQAPAQPPEDDEDA